MASVGARRVDVPGCALPGTERTAARHHSLDDASRNDLAALLTDVLGRLDRLYDEPLPYMLWLDQRPTDGGEWPTAWFHIEIVSPWRRAGTLRHIAAAEVAGGEFFNPVIPEDVAAQLRALA